MEPTGVLMRAAGAGAALVIAAAVAAASCARPAPAQREGAVRFAAGDSSRTARACLDFRAGRPQSGRVTVVDRRGQICDFSGPVRPGTSGEWLLQGEPGDACRLSLRRAGESLAVSDPGGACAREWCGRGIEFGSRKLSLARPGAPVCEQP